MAKIGLENRNGSEIPVARQSRMLGRVPLLPPLLSMMLLITLGACVSHEAHVRSDAEVCEKLGHPAGTADYQVCMKALNARRCEDRSSRDPMCQGYNSK
jgi:hypothetical protein